MVFPQARQHKAVYEEHAMHAVYHNTCGIPNAFGIRGACDIHDTSGGRRFI